MQYILIILFLLYQLLPETDSSLLPKLMFFLPLKNKTTHTKNSTKPRSLFSGQLLLSMRSALECTQYRSLGEENGFSFSQQLSFEQFLGKGWGLRLLPLPLSELAWLGLVWVLNTLSWVHICISCVLSGKMLFPWSHLLAIVFATINIRFIQVIYHPLKNP